MKKGLFLALIMLFNLNLVSAQQEITLFGNSYSLILVAPIFFMGLISLFFLGLIIKDNLKKIRIPKINIGKIRLKHEKTPIKEVKTDFLKKFNILKESINKINPRQYFNELSEIIKYFFKEKFSIKHEFAFAELNNLIKGHAKDVNLANKISTLKYSGTNINLPQIRLIISEFEDLLREYKKREVKIELGFWRRVRENFFDMFRKKQFKISLNSIPVKKPELNEEKTNILSKIFDLNKEKYAETINAKEEIKSPEIPKRRYKFILFEKLKSKIYKFKILKLIKKGEKLLDLNPLLAKRCYARALLTYYKLPVKEEKDILDNLMKLHDGILSARKNERMFLDISKNLIKHKGKPVSKESISIINTLRNFIEREELLASAKLKEFSHKLKNEERKLGHFVNNRHDENVKKDLSSLFMKKLNKPEIAQKTINLVDSKNHNFDFLYKQPKVKIEYKEEQKERTIKGTKELRILQKQRNELYHKLLEVEEGKIAHNKLN